MAKKESIKIPVNLDISEAEKAQEELKKKIAETGEALTDQCEKRVRMRGQMDEAWSELEKEKEVLQGEEKQLKALRTAAAEMPAESAKKLGMETQITEAEVRLEEQKETVNTLQASFEKLSSEAEEYEATIAKSIESLDHQKKMLGEMTLEAYKDVDVGAVSEAEAKLEQIEEHSESVAQTIKENLLDAEMSAAKTAEMATKMFVQINNFPSSKEKEKTNIFSDFSKKIKDTIISDIVKSGLGYLKTQISDYLSKNEQFVSALNRLKNGIQTAFQPILDFAIPILVTLMNILTAVVNRIGSLFAKLFGKSEKQSAEAAESLENEQKALSGVGGAAEEAVGSLAAFDEINTIQTEDKSGSGGGGGAIGTGSDMDPSLTDVMTERLQKIADLVLLIGAGFALWKIGSMLPGLLGDIVEGLGSILIFIGGVLLFWDGLKDAWENGVDWLNIIEMIGGVAIAAFGLYKLVGLFSAKYAPVAAGIALVVGGLVMLVTAFKDAMENGWNLQNMLLAIAGIFASGIGIALITHSWIPLLIAGVAAVLLAFTVATGHGEELINGIKSFLQGFIDFFAGIFTGDMERAIGGLEGIFGGLGTFINAIISGVQDVFLGLLDWFDEMTGGKLHGIIEVIKGVFSGGFEFIKQTITDVMSAIAQILGGVIEFLAGVFTNDWQRALEGVKEIFRGIWNGIVSILENAVNLIIRGINWMIGQLNRIRVDIPDWLGGGSIGFSIPTISGVSIPRLAQGTVVPPNREFMAILGDNTRETEVVSPLSTMKQAMLEALRESGGGGNGRPIQVNLVVDGKTLARVIVPKINDMTRQAGKPVLLI